MIGYRVSNGLRVTVRDTVTDTDNVGPSLTPPLKLGAMTSCSIASDFPFRHLCDGTAGSEAAVADLAAKAGQLAESAGRELGDLKLLTEGGGGGGGIFREFALEAAAAAYASDTPITAGEGEVTVIVFGVYELGEASRK